jgi:hypothetical protein
MQLNTFETSGSSPQAVSVYFMQAAAGGPIKIGYTRCSVKKRMAQLSGCACTLLSAMQTAQMVRSSACASLASRGLFCRYFFLVLDDVGCRC